jgi:hypothetical protein
MTKTVPSQQGKETGGHRCRWEGRCVGNLESSLLWDLEAGSRVTGNGERVERESND